MIFPKTPEVSYHWHYGLSSFWRPRARPEFHPRRARCGNPRRICTRRRAVAQSFPVYPD